MLKTYVPFPRASERRGVKSLGVGSVGRLLLDQLCCFSFSSSERYLTIRKSSAYSSHTISYDKCLTAFVGLIRYINPFAHYLFLQEPNNLMRSLESENSPCTLSSAKSLLSFTDLKNYTNSSRTLFSDFRYS